MKIALTGTPGVGKTKIADALEKMGYDVVRVEEIADEFVIGYDEKRESKIIDETALDMYVKKLKDGNILLIEGHVSHLLSVDSVILLRCHPEELKERLRNKGWSKGKIRENLEAEALDIILQRALEKHERIWEIDTTGKNAEEVVKEIAEIVKKMPYSCYGKIDWSEWLENHVG